MKWIYKVEPVDNLIADKGDHDIAVSKDASSKRKTNMSNSFEDNLNTLGQDGWEMISTFAEFAIFKKPAS